MEVNTTTTTAVKITGGALIATKIDIFSAVLFLLFFSLIHGLLVLHYSRQSKNEDDNVGFIDFVILTIIALGSGVMFTLFGIMSGRDELTIYMFGIVGSLLGIKGINAFLEFFTKKLGINLVDNKKKNDSK